MRRPRTRNRCCQGGFEFKAVRDCSWGGDLALHDLERLGIAGNDPAVTAFVHRGVPRASTSVSSKRSRCALPAADRGRRRGCAQRRLRGDGATESKRAYSPTAALPPNGSSRSA